ncbi:MAG: DUF3592 domain-containing protein [Pirellulales bacterium]|nr:DUF3592 domain-containing protein [Pirellulales bacterium]
MLIVGALLTALGAHFYLQMNAFEKAAHYTEGVVVDLKGEPDGLSTPVVQFFDVNGDRQVFVSRTASSPPKYRLDERVDVVYTLAEANASLEAYLYDKWNVRIRKFGVLAFGLLFLTLGVLFGRVFWNRDSTSIGFTLSKTIETED